MGWDAWYAEHLMKIQHPPMTDPNQLGARFGEFVANATRGAQFVVERGMVPWFDNAYIHFELDGATDIQAAYDILCGHHSIRGDVPATMFAFGRADEVNEYCEKLVTMGMKGGFMLSSGCEVPTNVKVDNLKALINFLK